MSDIGRRRDAARQGWYGRAVAIAATVAILAGLAGCAKSTPLPDLVKDPQTTMTKDEQKRAIADIGRGKEQAVVAAEKQIEKAR